MDIKQLARSLGITQQAAVSRATELLRLLKLKVPGGLGQGEICRPAVCLELACQTTPGSKLPVREEFIRYSCSVPKVYNEMFTKIQRLLDVRPALDLRELVTIFGCTQLEHHVQQLLRIYKSRLLESLPAADRVRADLSRPAFLAAAFLLTAKKHRATVDRAALMSKMGLTRTELAGALDDVAARCEDELATAGGARKRRRDGGGDGEQGEGDVAGPNGGAAGDKSGDAAEAKAPEAGEQRAAKRGKRATRKHVAEEQEEEDEAGRAADVAVEDLKLVLIGLAPASGPVVRSERKAGARSKQRVVRKRRPVAGSPGGAAAEEEDGNGEEGKEEQCGEVVTPRGVQRSSRRRAVSVGEEEEGL